MASKEACGLPLFYQEHLYTITFLFSEVAVYSIEKRIVPVHKPFSKSDAFYRVNIDRGLSHPFPL